MRPAPNTRRTRGRNNNPGRRSNLPNRNQTFDSNGPEVRIRGNAYQVHEKYLALARDASTSGDRVMSENYLQHAEHYYRIINAINEAYAQQQQQYDNPRDGYRGNNGQRDVNYPDQGGQDFDGRSPGGGEPDFGEDPRGFDDGGSGESDDIGEGGGPPATRTDSREPGFDPRNEAGRPDGAAAGGANGSSHEPSRSRPRRRPGRPRPTIANGADAPVEPTNE